MEPTKKKIAIVGDCQSGKSTLAMVLCGHPFTEDPYQIWNFKCIHTILAVENDTVELEWWDLKANFASEDCRIRPLLYEKSAVVLICFNIGNPKSLERIESLWYPEISYWCPEVPIIIVGTKKDQRSPNVQRLQVSFDEGKAVAIKVKALAYVECSAMTAEGVEDLLMVTARASLLPQQRRQDKNKNKNCVLL